MTLAQSQPLVTQEIRYHMPEAGEVFLSRVGGQRLADGAGGETSGRDSILLGVKSYQYHLPSNLC